jgi:hypothetical protein
MMYINNLQKQNPFAINSILHADGISDPLAMTISTGTGGIHISFLFASCSFSI